jgi:hypothetical protein
MNNRPLTGGSSVDRLKSKGRISFCPNGLYSKLKKQYVRPEGIEPSPFGLGVRCSLVSLTGYR